MEVSPPADAPHEQHEAQTEFTGPKAALTPPTSEDMNKKDHHVDSSDLSDIEDDDDDIGEIEPAEYYEGGKIPVFRPTMDQFRSFKKMIDKIDKYGMKSGIVKVVPPPEWREQLPSLEEAIKTIKVKNPIYQEFSGTHGTYTQANIEKQRTYNLPQWKALTEESNHQPPLKRGERRKDTAAKPKPRDRAAAAPPGNGEKRRPGRPRKRPLPSAEGSPERDTDSKDGSQLQTPPTPKSPQARPVGRPKKVKIEDPDDDEKSPSKPKGRQPKAKSISERRKYNQRDIGNEIDEEAFKGFDYRLEGVDDFTPARCRELEENYWKTLNYGTPMYGADMPGSLFDERTTSWNVAKLENLLDVLGTKVPGVNTAYLYLGMWKATFAWHLEDVDLYSINYIHFGAPKQWYSISQEDARKFERAMQGIWPTDYKNCSQFLRHKTYLISPDKLKKDFNITVNRLVHNEGEFVITYPYGYHSGFNLGYNCAESVNFATEAWMEYGKIAKKCNCEADSVWVDVAEIERKLRGEPTPEYEEVTDDEDDMDDIDDEPVVTVSKAKKPKAPSRKRKRDSAAKEPAERKVKKVKLRVKLALRIDPPCVLCPNDIVYDIILPTDNGQKAHRLCGMYTPETKIKDRNGTETVCGVNRIDKARLELKCNHCRSKRGSVFQCSNKKCTRAYHATCAVAAGVLVDTGPTPIWGEDGTEYWEEGHHFLCRYHRPKRGKNIDWATLEDNKLVYDYAKGLKKDDPVQVMCPGSSSSHKDFSEVFGGVVLENRPTEQTLLMQVLPDGDCIEVEWKWLEVLDPAKSQRPRPSANAKPMPEDVEYDEKAFNATNRKDGVPSEGDPFHDPNSIHKWAEFHTASAAEVRNREQAKVDLKRPDQLWFYLGKTSTEAKAQYTEDPNIKRYNLKSNYLDAIKPAPATRIVPNTGRALPASYTSGASYNALNAVSASQGQQLQPRLEKPYVYKPKTDVRPPTDPRSPSAQYSYGAQHGYGTQHGYGASYGYGTQQQQSPYGQPGQSGSQAYANGQQWRGPGVSSLANYHNVYSRGSPQGQPQPEYAPPTPKYSPPPYSHAFGGVSSAIDPNLSPPSARPSSQGYHAMPPNPYHNYQQARRQYHSSGTYGSQQQQRSAPVANMMARPSHSPSNSQTSVSKESNGRLSTADYMIFIRQFPYLLNSYMRRPKTYVSPYAIGGGFTDPWKPIPPYDPPPRSTYRPQYQSDHDFQRQVAKEGNRPGPESSTLLRFEDRIRQLAATFTPGQSFGSPPCKRPQATPPASLSTSSVSGGSATGGASADRPLFTPPVDKGPFEGGPNTPKRPEYSPLSDMSAPSGTPTQAQSQPQMHFAPPTQGVETWRWG